MEWMAWTTPSALFFVGIGCIILTMVCWEIVSPTVASKGFLPITTTRGDRIFISLLSAAFIHLGFIGLTMLPLSVPLAIAIIWLFIVMKWG
ncbi:MAG: putative small integral membrane protein [Psychromonas sp.]|jgi:predicted small integral membrane protein